MVTEISITIRDKMSNTKAKEVVASLMELIEDNDLQTVSVVEELTKEN